MYIAFPNCSFKCGKDLCQNSPLAKQNRIDIDYDSIVKRYIENDLTNAIVFAGLEPFDDYLEMFTLIKKFREVTEDDIVIYTGYNKDEFTNELEVIKQYGIKNIIIKFGRFIPNQKSHYDEILGVSLASDNQFAERIC
jgi:hypothetical protein